MRQPCASRRSRSGFSLVDQTKIVTAASELARNTMTYGGGGEVTIELLVDGARRGLRLVFDDQGPGIPDIEPGAEGRLHDRRRPRSRAGRRQAAVERVCHRLAAGEGTRVTIARWK